MSTPNLDKLDCFAQENTSDYPRLHSNLKRLRKFVGADEIKESVAKSVQYVISHQLALRPIRKSKRKRKEAVVQRRVSKRRRAQKWNEDENITAFKALITAALMQQEQESDSDYEPDTKDNIPDYMKGIFQHTLLLGNPGTGKTTFAHLLVDIWDALGIVDKKRFFVTSRGDWVGKYQGHSVAKAKKLIAKAKGGVLFIDEAYSLIAAKDGDDTYGHEVLTEIVESMSNVEKNVVFIFAGYENDMKRLFDSNRGLSRRFGYIYKFKKPNPVNLFLIFQKQLRETKWKIPKVEHDDAIAFFKKNSCIFEWGGGSTVSFIQHAKQAAIARNFPNPPERKILICDLKEAHQSMLHHNKTTDSMPAIIKNMYL